MFNNCTNINVLNMPICLKKQFEIGVKNPISAN